TPVPAPVSCDSSEPSELLPPKNDSKPLTFCLFITPTIEGETSSTILETELFFASLSLVFPPFSLAGAFVTLASSLVELNTSNNLEPPKNSASIKAAPRIPDKNGIRQLWYHGILFFFL